MKKKFLSTYILIAILALLAVAVYFIKVDANNEKQVLRNTDFYENFTQNEVDKIEVLSSEDNITLIKKEDSWYKKDNENEIEIENSGVVSALGAVQVLKVGEPVTEKADKQKLFQVDGSIMQLKFYKQDQEIVNFYIGKSTPNFNGVYVRKEGEKNIYQANKRINGYFAASIFQAKENNK